MADSAIAQIPSRRAETQNQEHGAPQPLFEDAPEPREHVRLDETIRHSPVFLQTVIDAMPDVMLVIDRDCRVVLANRAARAAAGDVDPVAECLRCYEMSHHRATPCEGRTEPCPLQQAIATKAPVSATHTHYDAQGREAFVDISASPVLDEAGEVSHIIEVCRDVTASKRRVDRLARLSQWKERLLGPGCLLERLGLITDSVVEVFAADFARIWVIREGDLCNKGCRHALVTEGPDVCRDRSRCLHLVASSGRYADIHGSHRRVPLGCYKIGRIASGEDVKLVTNDVTHDPRVHDHAWAEGLGLASFAGYRLVSPEGKPLGVMALFSRQPIEADDEASLQDLANTASQVIRTGMAEEALRQAQDRLLLQQQREKELIEAELDKARETLVRQTRLATVGQLSASIAHELRNPLASIGYAATLLRHTVPDEPKCREYMDIIGRELQGASEIIDDCMAISRGRPPVKSAVSLPAILAEARSQVDAPEGIQWRFPTGAGPFVTAADASQLTQVFKNLFANAAQAIGRSGTIAVEAAHGDEYDEIRVRDTGPGIPDEMRDQVFEPLVTTKARGTGLGLTICRQIIEQHGGSIKVLAGNGPGTTFQILLPREADG